MTERQENPRSKATREWRERTGLRLVQVYLQPDTVEVLDELVDINGASGRSKVIESLIYRRRSRTFDE